MFEKLACYECVSYSVLVTWIPCKRKPPKGRDVEAHLDLCTSDDQCDVGPAKRRWWSGYFCVVCGFAVFAAWRLYKLIKLSENGSCVSWVGVTASSMRVKIGDRMPQFEHKHKFWVKSVFLVWSSMLGQAAGACHGEQSEGWTACSPSARRDDGRGRC